MNYFNKTSKMLYSFTGLLIFAILFCMLLTQASPKKKHVSSAPAVSASQLTNPQKIVEQSLSISTSGKIIYGKSGLNVNLICDKIDPVKPVKAELLMTFEIHGYEDLAPKDGQILVNIGNSIVNYFAANRNLLNQCELYIVPSANPDGLAHGYTNNGVGRCQVSLGVNINGDFSYNFKANNTNRDRTLSKPFATPESRALKDLVDTIKPNAVIDCHGWENDFIGDEVLADCFKPSLNMIRYNFPTKDHGFFSEWAGTQGARAMLLEYPQAAYYNSGLYVNKTISGIENLVNKLSS